MDPLERIAELEADLAGERLKVRMLEGILEGVKTQIHSVCDALDVDPPKRPKHWKLKKGGGVDRQNQWLRRL
jgi:hypothetical protein